MALTSVMLPLVATILSKSPEATFELSKVREYAADVASLFVHATEVDPSMRQTWAPVIGASVTVPLIVVELEVLLALPELLPPPQPLS